MMSNSDVVRAYFAACEAGDLGVVDRLFGTDFVSRACDGSTLDLAGQRAALAAFLGEFENLKLTVHTMLESGDRVVTHYTHRATPRGSEERVAWDRIVIHRVADG
ncbi:MAG: nuclear transport factor 2 family protein, partial [Spirochaetota bacterium]